MTKLIKVLAVAIMIAAGVTSYHTQLAVFRSWQVDTLTAFIAPISIDLLAVICSVAMHLPTITKAGRVTAVLVLVVAGSGSMAANWMAGTTVGAKAVHVGMVVCYLLAETVASQVRERAATATVVETVAMPEVEAEVLPVIPVSPAITAEGVQRAYSERHERRLRTGR